MIKIVFAKVKQIIEKKKLILLQIKSVASITRYVELLYPSGLISKPYKDKEGIVLNLSKNKYVAIGFRDSNSSSLGIKEGEIALYSTSNSGGIKSKIILKQNGDILIDSSSNIELNGNSKTFVTFTELDTALKKFTQILNTHTHTASSFGSPTTPPTPTMSIDISNAKTKTIFTGG